MYLYIYTYNIYIYICVYKYMYAHIHAYARIHTHVSPFLSLSLSLALSFSLHLGTPMSPFFAGSIGGLGGAQVTEDQEDGRYAVGTKKTQRRRVPRRSEKAKTGAAEWVRSTFKMFTVKCFHASFVSKK